MAEIITHDFVSAKSQSPDTTLVSKDEWNDGHVLSGGVNGQHILYDDTQANNARWCNGPLVNYAVASIVASTPTPISDLALYSFTLETTSRAVITYQILVYTATGAAAGSVTLVINGSDISSFSFPSAIAQPAGFTVPADFPAGANTVSLRLNIVGNVNVLTFAASICFFSVGI